MVTIEAGESGYRFKKTKERYRENGNVITQDMYEPSQVENWMIVCMIAFLILCILLSGGFNYWSIQNVVVKLMIIYSGISFVVLSNTGSVASSLTAERSEEICRAIVEMSDEEIELRESRRKRAIGANIIYGVVFFWLFDGSTGESGTWGEGIMLIMLVALIATMVTLPAIYYRHRATKRLKTFLLFKGAYQTSTSTSAAVERGISEKQEEKMGDFCPNCGMQLEEGMEYCPNCGTQQQR